MVEQSPVKGAGAQNSSKSKSEKEEAVARMAEGSEVASDDPSRSTLHTGNDHDGVNEARPEDQGSAFSGFEKTKFGSPGMEGSRAREQNLTEQKSAFEGISAGSGQSAEAAFDGRVKENFEPDTGNNDALLASGPTTNSGSSGGSAPAGAGPTNVQFASSGGNSGTNSEDQPREESNRSASDIELDSTTVAENAAGAVVGKISVVDPDAGDSHSFEVSDDRFEVVDGALRLKPDVTLDHEAEPELKIEVTAIDQDGARYSESFEVKVADINEGPEDIAIEADNGLQPGDLMFVGWDADNDDIAFVATKQIGAGETIYFTDDEWDGNQFVGSEQLIEWVVPDSGVTPGTVITIDMMRNPTDAEFDAGGAVDYIRGGGVIAKSNEMFWAFQGEREGNSVAPETFLAVIGNEGDGNFKATPNLEGTGLTPENGAIIIDGDEDFMQFQAPELAEPVSPEALVEAISDTSNWITADGSGNNNPNGTGFDVTIPQLEANEDGRLSIEENAAGAVVGKISVVDPDAGDSHSFELSDDRFQVVDGALRLKPDITLDHEAEPELKIEVTAIDQDGARYSESFEVKVADINEAPSAISLHSSPENLIQNGSFEHFDVREGGWRSFTSDDKGSWDVDQRIEVWDGLGGTEASEGEQHIELDAGRGVDRIGQSIETEAGQLYDLSMDLRERIAGGTDTVEVYWNDTLVAEINPQSAEWESVSIQVVGSGEDRFELREPASENDSYGALIDNISLTAAVNTIAENTPGALVGQVQVTDPDADDTHSFEVSDDRFEVVDGALQLKPDMALDHEAEPELKIEVTAIDQDGARYSESFEVKVADINEGPEDVTLSNTAVAENAAGAVVGKISVVDPDAGDSHSFEVSDDRFEVVDGALRLKPDMALDHEAEPELKIEVTAIDQDGARYSESFAIETVPVPQLDIATGFHAQYFDMNETLRKLDDVDWDAPPTHEEVVSDIDFQNGRGSFWEDGSTDTFGVQINGSVSVTEGGEFEFFLGGDDGATLFVNGAPVIDNDGLHGFRTRTGSVELEPGTHHIEVRYFENYGHAGLKLEWDGPGTDGRELVAAPGVQDAQTVNGTALNVELSTDSLGDNTSLTIKGLPEGTLIVAGEQMQSVGADGSADITGWDTSLLTVTPPVEFLGQVTAEVVATVKTSSGQNASSTQSLEFQVNSTELTPPGGEMVGGFHASYFDVNHSLRKLDDIDWSSDPTHQEFVADINYENGRGSFWENGSTDTFGAKITGQIEIETGGAYDFFLGGDDGAIMLINGAPVINNDGLHGFRTREGEIELEPGVYDIEVRYFENYGHAGLKLEWDGPDTDGRELLQAKPELAVEENGTLEVGIELNAGSENASVELSGLPIDTIIISGEEAAVVSDEPLDLSGWNLDLLEISPPPNFEGEVRGEITFSDTAFNGQSVSSSEPFSFTVGEPDSVSGPTAQDDMIQSDDAQNGSERQNDPYYDGESDGEADDVMTEPAQVQENHDAADLCMETHETAEW